MANIKQENLLNIALEATAYERENSLNLSSGVREDGAIWELIVKYVGDIKHFEEKYDDTHVIQLLGNYGVITTIRENVESITNEEEIIFVEKPKDYFFNYANYKSSACVTPVSVDGTNELLGRGVLVTILDSGIDIFNEEFLDDYGNTRIVSLWDQTVEYDSSYENKYKIGRVFDSYEINNSISDKNNISPDYNGHGTAVAGILAGTTSGIASEADIIIVKLNKETHFPRTTSIMMGVDYAVNYAINTRKPVVINISLGNNYGSHRGNSVFERFLSDVSVDYRCGIFVGSGNEGERNIHSSGIIDNNARRIDFTIGNYENRFSLDMWKSYLDDYDVSLLTPRGDVIGPFSKYSEVVRYKYTNMEIMVYYGTPNALEPLSEIYIDFVPYGDYIMNGEYSLLITPRNIIDGRYDIWMPGSSVINRNTKFLKGEVYGTFTVPSTAIGVISVGAYDSTNDRYATFSGRGFVDYSIKPDIVAPGVDVLAPTPLGDYRLISGTSVATPIAAGVGALLMEWGIVKGNDVFMFGERLKAVIKSGAGPIGAFAYYPNPSVGAGYVCLKESLRNI